VISNNVYVLSTLVLKLSVTYCKRDPLREEDCHPRLNKSSIPKYITPENYDHCRIKETVDGKAGGYGGLFSSTFISIAASIAFFYALPCYKGPSLGTNFTLACP
jgi:cystathionine beta-lyase/cystathionine gamma-synthase